MKELGEAAQRRTVVRGHVLSTSLVFSSTLMMDSLVIPRRRGTSLLRPRNFSCITKRLLNEGTELLTRILEAITTMKGLLSRILGEYSNYYNARITVTRILHFSIQTQSINY